MNIRTIILALSSCILVTNCASEYDGHGVVIGPEKTLEIPVSSSSILGIKLDVGEVTIIGTDSDQLTAKIIVECPGLDSRCANRLADLDWVSAMTGEQLTLMTNKHSTSRLSSLRYREARITTRIEIPKVTQVNLEMRAGDLKVHNVDACFNIDMDAGDIDLAASSNLIRSVDIDTGVGDASLNVEGHPKNEHRSLLVGAEVHWHDGSGDCQMKVDLQAGNAEIRLTE